MNINSMDSYTRWEIFSYLDYPTLAKSAQVCKLWYNETTEHSNWTVLVPDTLASAVQTQPDQTLKSKKLEIGRLAHSKTKTQIQNTKELRLRIGEFINNLQGNSEGTFFVLFQEAPRYWLKINVQFENKDERYKKIVDACIFNISDINTITSSTRDINHITDIKIYERVIKESPLICIESNIPYCNTKIILSDGMIKRINHINLPVAEYHFRKIISFPRHLFSKYIKAVTNLSVGPNWNDLSQCVHTCVTLAAVPNLVATLTLYAATGSPTLMRSPAANRSSVIATVVIVAVAVFNYSRHKF